METNQNQKRRQSRQEVSIVGEEKQAPKATAPSSPKPIEIPISFDAWWLQMQSKYKFKPELKASVQRHFESKGFMDYKKFNQGLRDFGFRT